MTCASYRSYQDHKASRKHLKVVKANVWECPWCQILLPSEAEGEHLRSIPHLYKLVERDVVRPAGGTFGIVPRGGAEHQLRIEPLGQGTRSIKLSADSHPMLRLVSNVQQWAGKNPITLGLKIDPAARGSVTGTVLLAADAPTKRGYRVNVHFSLAPTVEIASTAAQLVQAPELPRRRRRTPTRPETVVTTERPPINNPRKDFKVRAPA